MDLDEFRSFILESGLDVWTWIDMAISVASADHENELKKRRDGIIQRLYAPAFSSCQNCDHQFSRGTNKESEENEKHQQKQVVGFDNGIEELQPEKKADVNEEDEGEEDDDDEEQRKVLEIKTILDDPSQSEGCLIELLQRLVDMDTSFKVLKETDIGRHVSRLRKHSSNEVRRLVKILVRKWKDTVDEWVRLNTPMEEATQSNGERKSSHEDATKDKYSQIESDKMASDNKRLHQSYQGAKKQRTAQVMDCHNNIPKTKNGIVTNNGGGSVAVKY